MNCPIFSTRNQQPHVENTGISDSLKMKSRACGKEKLKSSLPGSSSPLFSSFLPTAVKNFSSPVLQLYEAKDENRFSITSKGYKTRCVRLLRCFVGKFMIPTMSRMLFYPWRQHRCSHCNPLLRVLRCTSLGRVSVPQESRWSERHRGVTCTHTT